jgi:hypothetical protein
VASAPVDHGNRVRVTIEWHDYNPRRYGKPWIATVTSWPVGGRPELIFGGYLGDDDGGDLEIAAAPGDIIRYGQRDWRAKAHSDQCNEWAVVQPDGSIRDITQAEARRLYAEAKRVRTSSSKPLRENSVSPTAISVNKERTA